MSVAEWHDDTICPNVLLNLSSFPNLKLIENLTWVTTLWASEKVDDFRPKLESLSVRLLTSATTMHPINVWFDLGDLKRFDCRFVGVGYDAVSATLFEDLPARMDELVLDFGDAADYTLDLDRQYLTDNFVESLVVKTAQSSPCPTKTDKPDIPTFGRHLTLSWYDGRLILDKPHPLLETLVFGPLQQPDPEQDANFSLEPLSRWPMHPPGPRQFVLTLAASTSGLLEMYFELPPKRGRRAQINGDGMPIEVGSTSALAARLGFDPTHAVQQFVDEVVRIKREHPDRLPRLREVGVIPQGGSVSFASRSSRAVTGINDMARKLKSVGLTFIDDDHRRWEEAWFHEV